MKKLILLSISLFFLSGLRAQGLKGVEIGDFGLTSPMWCRSTIETEIFDIPGDLSVERYNGKIYHIDFKATFFSQEYVDKLASSLKEKYQIKSLGKCIAGPWITMGENERIQIMIQPQNQGFGNRWYVVSIWDAIISKKVSEESKGKKDNNY